MSNNPQFAKFTTKELEHQLNVVLTMDNNGGLLAEDIMNELDDRYENGEGDENEESETAREEVDVEKSLKIIRGQTIEKGAKGMIGEIREWQGKKYKKQANGKWLEVSDKGMTKKEHINKMDDAYDRADRHTGSGRNDAHDEAIKHKHIASKLFDKEHSDEEVGLKGKKDSPYRKEAERLKKTYGPKVDKIQEIQSLVRAALEGPSMKGITPKQIKLTQSNRDTFLELPRSMNNDTEKRIDSILKKRGLSKERHETQATNSNTATYKLIRISSTFN